MPLRNVEVYLGENDQQSGGMDKGTNTRENHRLGKCKKFDIKRL